MSGSGPTCAFLARDAGRARELAVALTGSGVCRAVARASGPVPGAVVVPGPGPRPPAVMNLVNLEQAAKAYHERVLLDGVSLGVSAGQRIGVVGRNGAGKTTLLAALAGRGRAGLRPDDQGRGRDRRLPAAGRAARRHGRPASSSAAWPSMSGPPTRAAAPSSRLCSATSTSAQTSASCLVASAAGPRWRRCCVRSYDLLLLDEPTNHLDIEAITWLAGYLRQHAASYVVVTHDRWFLDAVTDQTWEVADGQVHAYEGGYSAYVLAKAERARIAAAMDQRRRNLLRKELAWLRRGPPAGRASPSSGSRRPAR